MGKRVEFSDIKSISDLDKASKEVVWQNFEKLVGFIFEQNGFDVKVNVVRMLNKHSRRQYDVVAVKGNKIILVECKKWAGDRYRLSALKKAIGLHKERCRIYDKKAVPVIATLIEEEIQFYDKIPIVPVFKLNGFIREYL